MYKKIGASLLIAGTCIGSGMIALPMVLAKLGLIPSIILMLFIWWVMYYTSLINLELILQAGHGVSLGSLGRIFSGRTAEWIGIVSLKLLSYSLLAVFIYGGSSVLHEFLTSKLDMPYSFVHIASLYSLLIIFILLMPIRVIDYFNRLLFMGLLVVVAILIIGLSFNIDWTMLPLFSNHYNDLTVWAYVVPVVFTSFGFQVIFHTLSNYCNMNAKMLQQTFFCGSLIPAIVYLFWTISTLSVLYHNNPEFYQLMIEGKVSVGELVQELGVIAKWQSVQLLVWGISFLAIATSVLGVGVGLCDSIQVMITKTIHLPGLRRIIASIMTIIPASIVVLYVPNAFIAVLGFAGMILAVIAVLLPVYLFSQAKSKNLFYNALRLKSFIFIACVVAIGVILSELFNMIESISG